MESGGDVSLAATKLPAQHDEWAERIPSTSLMFLLPFYHVEVCALRSFFALLKTETIYACPLLLPAKSIGLSGGPLMGLQGTYMRWRCFDTATKLPAQHDDTVIGLHPTRSSKHSYFATAGGGTPPPPFVYFSAFCFSFSVCCSSSSRNLCASFRTKNAGISAKAAMLDAARYILNGGANPASPVSVSFSPSNSVTSGPMIIGTNTLKHILTP